MLVMQRISQENGGRQGSRHYAEEKAERSREDRWSSECHAEQQQKATNLHMIIWQLDIYYLVLEMRIVSYSESVAAPLFKKK